MLRKIIQEFFELESKSLPKWLDDTVKIDDAQLKSYLWQSERCDKIRLCELEVRNKFYAESLVIYPEFCYETPIFGTEYLRISDKKYFGVIDFHPITENENYLKYLDFFLDRRINKTHFYDFDEFFSRKMWLSKRDTEFYNEYQIMVKCYLHQYKKCLEDSDKSLTSFEKYQIKYNEYMSSNDPAYGVLKCYFGKEFAENYISKFLFSNK